MKSLLDEKFCEDANVQIFSSIKMHEVELPLIQLCKGYASHETRSVDVNPSP